MPNRLETQRPPNDRTHERPNWRFYRRGYDTVPHPVWGDPTLTDILPPVTSTATVTTATPNTSVSGAANTNLVLAGTGFVSGVNFSFRLKGPPAGSWTPMVASGYTSATAGTATWPGTQAAGVYEIAARNPLQTFSTTNATYTVT